MKFSLQIIKLAIYGKLLVYIGLANSQAYFVCFELGALPNFLIN